MCSSSMLFFAKYVIWKLSISICGLVRDNSNHFHFCPHNFRISQSSFSAQNNKYLLLQPLNLFSTYIIQGVILVSIYFTFSIYLVCTTYIYITFSYIELDDVRAFGQASSSPKQGALRSIQILKNNSPAANSLMKYELKNPCTQSNKRGYIWIFNRLQNKVEVINSSECFFFFCVCVCFFVDLFPTIWTDFDDFFYSKGPTFPWVSY